MTETATQIIPNNGDKYAVLKDVFGFDRFRPGQQEVVDTLLALLLGSASRG